MSGRRGIGHFPTGNHRLAPAAEDHLLKRRRLTPLLALAASLLLLPVLRAAEPPATSPSTGNGGRDPSLPKDPDSPVVHTLRAARKLKTLKAAPLYSFTERDVDA